MASKVNFEDPKGLLSSPRDSLPGPRVHGKLMDDIGDEMIHGTPSRPVIDGGPIDQDEGRTFPYFWIFVIMIIIFILEFWLAWKLGIPIGNGGGNLTGSIVTIGQTVIQDLPGLSSQ